MGIDLKALSVVGARPQFVKAAAVCRAIESRSHIKSILVHTGQHYDANMSGVFFSELGLPDPDYQLGIGSGSHGRQTGRMLEALEGVIIAERPSVVVVYGDTNSTLAAALAAAKVHVPVAHVEAGLRSFNREMPEEINRVLTDHASDLLLAPTEVAIRNLRNEGLADRRVYLVGDVTYDAILYYRVLASSRAGLLEKLGLVAGRYILATVHRAENTDDPMRFDAIVRGLIETSTQIPVVLPVHPRTLAHLDRGHLLDHIPIDLRLIEPVGYLDMIVLEQNASVIVTDSGGVQKEAYFMGTPCITMRDETEWTELVETGWNTLWSPASGKSLVETVRWASTHRTGQEPRGLYGEGQAAQRVVQLLESLYS